MQILTLSDTLSPTEASVLTVGNFDGVHRGHRQLLQQVIERARASGLRSAAVTFDPHTRRVTSEGNGGDLLTTFEEKACLIGNLGIDYLFKVPFDGSMRQNSPENFIAEVLAGRLHMKEWVLGRGHAIGRDRAGNEDFLRAMEGKYHFSMFIDDLLMQEGAVISSTQIREFITQGRMTEAVFRLGHPYLISVERTSGIKLGTALGYPTLNFRNPPSRKVIPPAGVYAARVQYQGRFEEGALYFGGCPTFGGNREVHFEFYSFSRGNWEIPVGSGADLWVYSFIRPDSTFPGADMLVKQIMIDVEKIKTYFKEENMQCR